MNGSIVRVCIVTPRQSGGGAEYQIGLLIAALQASGRFEIHYLAHHIDEQQPTTGYRLVRIGRGERMPVFGYTADLLPLYAALRRIRPQVIYQRVGCGYTGICALYARMHQAALIWHVAHDTDVMPQSLDQGRNLVRRYLEKLSLRFGLHCADRIVVQTQSQSDLLARHYGRKADALVPNFAAASSERIDKAGPPLVVWVSNLKPWKRPQIFVRLARALQSVQGVQFVMVGEAPRGRGKGRWLDELLRDVNAAPNLRYLGHLPQEQVMRLLARACVFVNTSTHEGFPNTFIQAWMLGAVVVSLDVNPDQVLDREGIGIHAGSEQGLVAAVERLLSDPAFRAPYVRRAHEYVRLRHSPRNQEHLIALIEECAHAITSSPQQSLG